MASTAAISTDEDAPGADPAQPADERREREREEHADGERQQHRPAEIERRHHDRRGHEAQISQIKIGRRPRAAIGNDGANRGGLVISHGFRNAAWAGEVPQALALLVPRPGNRRRSESFVRNL